MINKYIFAHLVCVLATFACLANNRDSSAPFISGDTFRAIAQHVYDETSRRINFAGVRAGDIIFVKADYVEEFVIQALPKINSQVILIIHNSDLPFPSYATDFLNDPKIIAVFAQNIETFSHPKLFGLPIGIANRCWPHGNIHVFQKNIRPLFSNKTKLLYMNFSPSTYPKERPFVFDLFKNKKFCTVAQSNKNLGEYLSEMAEHLFVLSPRGNGLDCHRTWEALLVGSIPIVKSSGLDPLYRDLPVLIIDTWEDITEEFLLQTWEDMKRRTFAEEKRFAHYWVNIMCALRP